jgi:hypothetical protein
LVRSCRSSFDRAPLHCVPAMPKPGFLGAAARGPAAVRKEFFLSLPGASAPGQALSPFGLDRFRLGILEGLGLGSSSYPKESFQHIAMCPAAFLSFAIQTSAPFLAEQRAGYTCSVFRILFWRAPLHCVPASQNRAAGSSCARACGARNYSGGSLYGTTSQPSIRTLATG